MLLVTSSSCDQFSEFRGGRLRELRLPLNSLAISNYNIGTQCVQSQWRFVPQYGKIMGFTPLQCRPTRTPSTTPPPPQQLAVNQHIQLS